MAYLTFTDGLGAATLRPNLQNALGNRLRGWTPASNVVGDRATALGTGLTYQFRYRTDYGASFTLPGISAHYSAADACFPLEVADRLIAFLSTGGTATLSTEDNAASTYTVAIAPGTTPQLRQSSASLLEYELQLAVIRADGVAAPMVCRYGTLT